MAKKLAIMFGVVFVLVGVLGMISTPIAGPMGLFQTNSLHDYVHLLIGIVLLVVAFAASDGTASSFPRFARKPGKAGARES